MGLLMKNIKCDPVVDVVAEFKKGRPVIIIDDPERENEGDIAIAAESITPEDVSFMMKYARGLICTSISVETAEQLNLPLQVPLNSSPFNTPFAVTVSEKSEPTSSISAKSRANTIKALANPGSKPSDFNSPGCVFPLVANPRGVLGEGWSNRRFL